jgi:hypothetical protein
MAQQRNSCEGVGYVFAQHWSRTRGLLCPPFAFYEAALPF